MKTRQLHFGMVVFALLVILPPSNAQPPLDWSNLFLAAIPKTNCVGLGEAYESRIVLVRPVELPPGYTMEMMVGLDEKIPVQQGIGHYLKLAPTSGWHEYDIWASIVHNETGNFVKMLRAEYDYSVGQRGIHIGADKMNVLYVGVDNPISLTVSGMDSRDVRVVFFGDISSPGPSSREYIVRPNAPGNVTITATGKDAQGKFNEKFTFRAKRIPDPQLYLGGKPIPDKLSAANLKVCTAVQPVLDGFDFDVQCDLMSFELVRLGADGTRSAVTNTGMTFGAVAQTLLGQAAPEDVYLFRAIQCQCAGDEAPRRLTNFSVEIE